MSVEKVTIDNNLWNSTIESISAKFGTITASISDASPTDGNKRRKNNHSENRVWKSKVKSLSEEPMGLEGLRKAEERRGREREIFSLTPIRHITERRSCRLRFKSPSDNSQCSEKASLHQTSLVRHNQMQLRAHCRGLIPASISENSVCDKSTNVKLVPVVAVSIPIPTPQPPAQLILNNADKEEKKPSVEKKKQIDAKAQEPSGIRRQNLKRRARSD